MVNKIQLGIAALLVASSCGVQKPSTSNNSNLNFGNEVSISQLVTNSSTYQGKFMLIDVELDAAFRSLISSHNDPNKQLVPVYDSIPALNASKEFTNAYGITFSPVPVNEETIASYVAKPFYNK